MLSEFGQLQLHCDARRSQMGSGASIHAVVVDASCRCERWASSTLSLLNAASTRPSSGRHCQRADTERQPDHRQGTASGLRGAASGLRRGQRRSCAGLAPTWPRRRCGVGVGAARGRGWRPRKCPENAPRPSPARPASENPAVPEAHVRVSSGALHARAARRTCGSGQRQVFECGALAGLRSAFWRGAGLRGAPPGGVGAGPAGVGARCGAEPSFGGAGTVKRVLGRSHGGHAAPSDAGHND